MYTSLNSFITRETLKALLSKIDGARIGLIGDLCLDMYWLADMRLSELSRETPHYPMPVVEERFSPGGAGNVACNIAALRPGKLVVAGLVGSDWRGDLLKKALTENGIDCGCIVEDGSVITNTYIKPLRRGVSDVIYEDPRLDFENRAPLSSDCEARILEALEALAQAVDVICVSDQMKYGCITRAVRARLSQLGAEGKTIIVDSRDHIAEYKNVILKPNEVETSRAFGSGEILSMEALSTLAQEVSAARDEIMLITLGENGAFWARNGEVVHCPARLVEPPIDFCGAGDTFLAGFGTLFAAGAAPEQAMQIANICSSVTIKKLGTTGTATRAEILAAYDAYAAAQKG